jgi:hypothetical protein
MVNTNSANAGNRSLFKSQYGITFLPWASLGVEPLLEASLIGPFAFVPIAEETGLLFA